MIKLVLLAPVLALALTGCAHDPTIAGRVAGQPIAISDVTTLANFMCAGSKVSAQPGTSQQAVPMALVNEKAMTLLVGARALQALASEHNRSVPVQPAVSGGAALALIPASERQRAQQLINEVNNAFTFVAETTHATDPNQVMEAFLAVIQTEASEGHLSANPAYPVMSSSTGLQSGSLSQAISNPAAAAMTMAPTAAYVASLPASQKCG